MHFFIDFMAREHAGGGTGSHAAESWKTIGKGKALPGGDPLASL